MSVRSRANKIWECWFLRRGDTGDGGKRADKKPLLSVSSLTVVLLGRWVLPCESCDDSNSCYWREAVWAPNTCQYNTLTRDETRSCLAGKKVRNWNSSTLNILAYIVTENMAKIEEIFCFPDSGFCMTKNPKLQGFWRVKTRLIADNSTFFSFACIKFFLKATPVNAFLASVVL